MSDHLTEKSNPNPVEHGNDSTSEGKTSVDAEALRQSNTHSTFIDASEGVDSLSQEHRQYLLNRHGTLDLDPIPGYGDADPYNWPDWKKSLNLALVAFHAAMSTFTAAAIIPAYEYIAMDLHVSIQRASYLTSLQIAIIGGGPLLWRPIANRYGRRPVFLFSLITSLVCNIGCANSPGYGSMAACRALTAFFICPAAAIGSAVVAETTFKKQRARFMGVWTIMVTLGVPVAPFIFGFVAYRVSYRWIYYVLAITNGVQFILYLFFGPETRYIRRGVEHHGSSTRQQYMSLSRIDPTPFRWFELIHPLKYTFYLDVFLPAWAYAMVFCVTGVLTTVEIPQLFVEKFHFNSQEIGLQYLSVIIGTILGEQIGGVLSDWWMNQRRSKVGDSVLPEFRLWLSHIGYVLAIAGIVVFLVQLDKAPLGHWNVTPVVGVAIAAGGNQIVTTVLITYSVDCHPSDAASVGVFITFVRQIWSFIGPFWFPQMFANAGLRISAVIVSVLMIAISILPTIYLQVKAAMKKH